MPNTDDGRRRPGRLYAILLDIDPDKVAEVRPGGEADLADIVRFMAARGLRQVSEGLYFGDEAIDAVRCVLLMQDLADRYDWFVGSVREARLLRIEEVSDLRVALEPRSGGRTPMRVANPRGELHVDGRF